MEQTQQPPQPPAAVDFRQEKQPVTKKKGFLREVFGQFLQPTFWRDLMKLIVHEMVTAFFKAFGGALIWYGEKKSSPETAEIRSFGQYRQQQATTPAAAAFSRGFQPTPEYRTASGYGAPVPPPPNDQNFPGFGGR